MFLICSFGVRKKKTAIVKRYTKMSECDICKKHVFTYSSARWEQTGIELHPKEHEDISIILCWDCYDNYAKDNKEILA